MAEQVSSTSPPASQEPTPISTVTVPAVAAAAVDASVADQQPSAPSHNDNNGTTDTSSAAPAEIPGPAPAPVGRVQSNSSASGASADGGGVAGGGSTAAGTEARGDAAPAAAAASAAGSAAGAAKEEPGAAGGGAKKDGGSQAQPRSAKRPRDAPLPVGLPKSMVRRIMKLGEETRNISNEALVIVVKASELFLERFASQAFDHAEKLGRKTIKYRDVSDVRVEDPNLLFLEAVVPP